MKPEEIQTVADIVKARSGQIIGADKRYLIEGRLAPVARQAGFASVGELVAAARDRENDGLSWAVTDALLASETWFFRDRALLETLGHTLLPALSAVRPGGEVRVWCAGCSTGQEAYTLAMLAEDVRARHPGLRLELVATDISRRLLEKAKAGLYTQFEVQRGLSIHQLLAHFEQEGENWRLSPAMRQTVRWRAQNLLEDFSGLGRFDVILCRNVVSGMDELTRERVLARLRAQLSDDGVLLLSQDEETSGQAFRAVADLKGLYVKTPERKAAA